DQAVLVELEPVLHLGILVEVLLAAGFGDQHAVDEPVEQHRIDLGERQFLDLRRQVLLRRLDVGKVQLGSVDARNHCSTRGHPARSRGARAWLSRRTVSGEQDATTYDSRGDKPGGTDPGKRSYRETRMHCNTYNGVTHDGTAAAFRRPSGLMNAYR